MYTHGLPKATWVYVFAYITTECSALIGTLGVVVHTSETVDETVGLNCDLKRLEAKPQTTKQHQQHALVVF